MHAEHGYYWITGRVDDVINVSGHRIGSAEVESALVQHAQCAEAAVIGVPHAVKGEAVYAFVTLCEGQEFTDRVRQQLITCVLSLFASACSQAVVCLCEWWGLLCRAIPAETPWLCICDSSLASVM